MIAIVADALCIAQGRRERAQHATGPLKTLELSPFLKQDVREFRIEGEGLQIPLLLLGPLALGLIIELADSIEGANDLRLPAGFVGVAFWGEKTAAQNLRHVLPLHRLDPAIGYTLEHVIEDLLHLFAQFVTLGRVRRQQ